VQRGPIDQRITGKIEGFWRILGDPIYGEILRRVARTQKANAIPNAQLQATVAEAMERASRGIRKAQSLAESIGDTQFVSVLDRLHVGTMTTISNLEALKHLCRNLKDWLANQPPEHRGVVQWLRPFGAEAHTLGTDDASRSGTCPGPFPADCLPR